MAGAHERPKGPRKQQFDARSYTQRLVVPRDADPREEARRAAERKAQDLSLIHISCRRSALCLPAF